MYMMLDNLDQNVIQDENAQELIRRLMNIIENQAVELRKLKKENQRLRDEVNRLKGEQGKPKTKVKKDHLLLVLKHPELPLHNNASELGVRQRVQKRDVSFGPCIRDGARAWDTFVTLSETTKKLHVSFYLYLQDRISELHQIQPLADLVKAHAEELNLGWSFSPTSIY